MALIDTMTFEVVGLIPHCDLPLFLLDCYWSEKFENCLGMCFEYSGLLGCYSATDSKIKLFFDKRMSNFDDFEVYFINFGFFGFAGFVDFYYHCIDLNWIVVFLFEFEVVTVDFD